jgi:hypothetical protein
MKKFSKVFMTVTALIFGVSALKISVQNTKICRHKRLVISSSRFTKTYEFDGSRPLPNALPSFSALLRAP